MLSLLKRKSSGEVEEEEEEALPHRSPPAYVPSQILNFLFSHAAAQNTN
jgi:hypothetical protein